MSDNFDELELLKLYGRVRRQLNLKATHLLRPLGIGTKQALVLRELLPVKWLCLSELARQTHTDPGATGKIVDSLIRKGWVKRTDHPGDRRRWAVSLTAEGARAAHKLNALYRRVAGAFCAPLSLRQKRVLHEQLRQISERLEKRIEELKEES
jgi:DNA-binding MarR family transcriptional regulator